MKKLLYSCQCIDLTSYTVLDRWYNVIHFHIQCMYYYYVINSQGDWFLLKLLHIKHPYYYV